MPFRPELSYLYRFLKQHVEERFEIRCERADDRVLTIPLLDKIKDMIANAVFVIADISGRNPNVFYELGMAHVTNKSVILITHDDVTDAPTDIKAYEFIRYTQDHDAFAGRLDTAIRGIIGGDYEELYEATRTLFVRFREASGLPLRERSKEEFIKAVTAGYPASSLPDPGDESAVASKLILLLLSAADADVAAAFVAWKEATYP
jgi:hypothetical protein